MSDPNKSDKISDHVIRHPHHDEGLLTGVELTNDEVVEEGHTRAHKTQKHDHKVTDLNDGEVKP